MALFQVDPRQAFSRPQSSLASFASHFNNDLSIATPRPWRRFAGDTGSSEYEMKGFALLEFGHFKLLVQPILQGILLRPWRHQSPHQAKVSVGTQGLFFQSGKLPWRCKRSRLWLCATVHPFRTTTTGKILARNRAVFDLRTPIMSRCGLLSLFLLVVGVPVNQAEGNSTSRRSTKRSHHWTTELPKKAKDRSRYGNLSVQQVELSIASNRKDQEHSKAINHPFTQPFRGSYTTRWGGRKG